MLDPTLPEVKICEFRAPPGVAQLVDLIELGSNRDHHGVSRRVLVVVAHARIAAAVLRHFHRVRLQKARALAHKIRAFTLESPPAQ